MKIIIFAVVFLASYAGVERFRRWSIRREFFDIPNERSSHTAPTPRGGGAVIAVVSLICYAGYTNFVTHNFAWSYFLGAALIAAISWLDDVYDISFAWRILVHAAAAALVIITLGFWSGAELPLARRVEFGVFGAVVTFFWIVWLTNAYNFMDGIDGIAGMQAITAGIGWLLIGNWLGCGSAGFYGGALAFSSLGFLLHNWQPAKIFMGDVGSAFLGYSFAVLPLLAKSENDLNAPVLPVVGVALVMPFVADTLVTFARRIFKREKIWRAHRSHLYQQLVISGFSHRTVAFFYGLVSLLITGVLVFWLNTAR